jgi:hypothetical protein
MERRGRSRNWVPLACLLVLAGCGSDEQRPAASKATPAASADQALAKRCRLRVAGDDGGFPAGLLPARSVVSGDGNAMVAGELGDVYRQLHDNAAAAGLTVRGDEMETFDAEIELEGPDGEFELRLSLPDWCPRATQVRKG